MTIPERLEFLAESVEKNDAQSVAALTLAPAYLSGLTAEQTTAFKRLFLEKNVPLDVGYLDSTEQAMSAIVEACDGVLSAS